ncbi:hypothetical protein GCM10011575_31260 [Microlunatus endophyticus]|uniref:Uncharacterized protein n=1 Tax=Microlunatus endophyticus TaxID=1716077 RepID=A0A917SBM1_9ACTN|nr:hypothetical protein [Microlunatus endophyticus]GGL70543.1 hypothetical protein GCM10011575_31260 [Microlunatus endophyticus]
MDQLVAQTITRATREEAQRQAADDLDTLRRQAVEAGRERSRTVFKISMIDDDSGTISYNRAGRLLRDWYLHVYINTLRSSLSQPSEVIDLSDRKETASLLEELRPNAAGAQAALAVRSAEMIAVSDAARAVASIAERLHHAGAVRAIHHAPEDRFDGDELRVHVIRHWYEHCYDDLVDRAVRARHPLEVDVRADDDQIVLALTAHEIRQIISSDGLSLAALELRTRELQQVDGDTQAIPSPTAVYARLAHRLSEAWNNMDETARAEWLDTSDQPVDRTNSDWSALDGGLQRELTGRYVQMQRHDLHQPDLSAPLSGLGVEEMARRLFNHSEVLAPRAITRLGSEPDLDRILPLAHEPDNDRRPMRRES